MTQIYHFLVGLMEAPVAAFWHMEVKKKKIGRVVQTMSYFLSSSGYLHK